MFLDYNTRLIPEIRVRNEAGLTITLAKDLVSGGAPVLILLSYPLF